MAEALEVTPAELDAFADRLGEVESYLHLDEKRTRVFELEAKSVAPGFWDDADAARATMEEIARTKEDIAAVDTARGELSDARSALDLRTVKNGKTGKRAQASWSCRECAERNYGRCR